MQLDQFYIGIIQLTLYDALAIGAGAAMLVGTFFGIKLKRQESGTFPWLFGGAAGITFGTIFGYYIMNTVGYIVAMSGSSIHSLAGTDLLEWTETIALFFAPYQMHAAGFAMIGVLFGLGWGHGIGSRPADTSLVGNLIATLGIVAIVAGFLLTLSPGFLVLPYDTAFLYLLLVNGLIVLGYGIRFVANQMKGDSPDSPPEEETSEREGPEELIE
ncbi:MAG: hypothetical protein RTU63_03985 [Candidatus Thorarchaeota archaeon]